MKITLTHRHQHETVLWAGEADSLRAGVETAIGSGADLSEVDLSGANLSWAMLINANLCWANLSRADLSQANLGRAMLIDANLSEANLFRADLSQANLGRANLCRANLDRAMLIDANLSEANLFRADLSQANLGRANLCRANLSGANLGMAMLINANLYRANLSGVDLSTANLSKAALSNAALTNASLSGAIGIIPERTTPLLMLLDQPGAIRAYKLIRADGRGVFYPTIQYQAGVTYEAMDANTDRNIRCDRGINVATLDWCLDQYQPGCRVLIVEFTAKDIACIPTATDGKFRLFRCTVVGEKNLDGLVEASGAAHA